MKPGPKARVTNEADIGVPGRTGISMGWLSSQAYVWNMVLHAVRDGVPGFIAKAEGAKRAKTILAAEVDYLEFHDAASRSGRQRRRLSRRRKIETEFMQVAIVAPEKVHQARQLIKGKEGWVLTAPRYACPEMWERLKKAGSVVEVQRVARDLHVRYRAISAAQWKPLHDHAPDFLRAKALHNYPKSKRPCSDEKRMHFCAKVLSGFMQDIAPATATKRLARLSLPTKRELRRSFEDEAAWLSKPQFRKRPMRRLVSVERERGSSDWWNVYEDEKERTWRERRET